MGSLYLFAVMDRHSRNVLSGRPFNSHDSEFRAVTLHEALHQYGPPEIFNTDQKCPFANDAFTQVRKDACALISIDGKRCWVDNVFIEGLRRSFKHEEGYLEVYENMCHARQWIRTWMEFYNQRSKRQSLEI